MFYDIVTNVMFNFCIYFLILGNTVTLALYRYDQSDLQTRILEICDIIFVWAFFVEMVMKLIGLGVREYLRDNFNIFDGVIVIISLIDFSITLASDSDDNEGGILNVFRALRLLRVIKLGRKWKNFQKIIQKMLKSVISITNFTVLLCLFMFILALLGMEMFAYSVAFNSEGEEILGKQNVQEAFLAGEELTWPRENFNQI